MTQRQKVSEEKEFRREVKMAKTNLYKNKFKPIKISVEKTGKQVVDIQPEVNVGIYVLLNRTRIIIKTLKYLIITYHLVFKES